MIQFPFPALGALAAAVAIGLATMAPAQDAAEIPAPVVARQAHMDLYQFNLMTLGGMAQDKIPYDAAAAQAAAANLLALAGMQTMNYWQPGTAAGEVAGSRALPALWENMADVGAKSAAASAAIAAMDAAAGNGIDALKAAMGPLGGACAACHKAYRAP